MTRGQMLVATIKDVAQLVDDLPPGAVVSIEWPSAPPDLVLEIALQRGGHLRLLHFVGGGETNWAEWKYKGVTVRAYRGTESDSAKLRLVKP